jgi:hypothetical protein
MPFQRIPRPGPVIVAGGTIDSVSGSVGSVAGNVTPDPASSIAVVTTNVPLLGRDWFYWPAMSGEQFAPVFSSATYSTYRNTPAYVSSTSAATVTFPRVPRTNPITGKQGVKLAFLVSIISAGSPGSNAPLMQWGSSFALLVNATSRRVLVNNFAGTLIDTGFDMPTDAWVTVEIDIAANGQATYIFNGVVKLVSAGAWPVATLQTDIQPKLMTANYVSVAYSQLQFTWV